MQDTEKENLIALYREVLKEVITIDDEIKQVEELLKISPETWIALCNARIDVLKSKIMNKRVELLWVCSRGVQTFWPIIITEF